MAGDFICTYLAPTRKKKERIAAVLPWDIMRLRQQYVERIWNMPSAPLGISKYHL